jgi:hypothetical protein
MRIRARQPEAEEIREGDFSQAMDKVFGHHAPLLRKLSR